MGVISEKTMQNILDQERFRFVFTCPDRFLFIRKRLRVDAFSPVVETIKEARKRWWNWQCMTFFTIFKILRFHSIGRFSVDDRRNACSRGLQGMMIKDHHSLHATENKGSLERTIRDVNSPYSSWLNRWMHGKFPSWDLPAGDHGSFIHANKYPVQDDDTTAMIACRLVSQRELAIGRALHWYRRGHGFKSSSSLRFLGFTFATD